MSGSSDVKGRSDDMASRWWICLPMSNKCWLLARPRPEKLRRRCACLFEFQAALRGRAGKVGCGWSRDSPQCGFQLLDCGGRNSHPRSATQVDPTTNANLNLMPGDTKLSTKWHSSWRQRQDLSPISITIWEYPVRQILEYCTQEYRRYGFIITDAELVVMRITPRGTAAGSAIARESRQPQVVTHNRNVSATSTISQLSASLRGISVTTDSSYQSTGLGCVDGYKVEYCSIPWENEGKKDLTVHLGLFYLSWLAAVGQGGLQFKYPKFDSCWPRLDGTFIHNTTGLAVKKPTRLEQPDGNLEPTPHWIEVEGGERVMTLQSARNLSITESNGRYYYYYTHVDESGASQPLMLGTGFPVYDEESGQYGYFDSLTWRVGSPSQPSSSKRPRRR